MLFLLFHLANPLLMPLQDLELGEGGGWGVSKGDEGGELP